MLPAKRCLSYKFMNADCVPVAYEMFKVCVRVCVCVCVCVCDHRNIYIHG
jgi:hypothetical protein